MHKNHSATNCAFLLLMLAGANACAAPVHAPSKDVALAQPTYVCPMEMVPGREYAKPGYCPGGGMELIRKDVVLRVAILVYDGVEEIDYAGPMEVFGASGASVFTVGQSTDVIHSVFGLSVKPDFDIENAPKADVLLIPGGSVSTVTRNPALMNWILQRSGDSRFVMSVCTGAFILGKAGLLDGVSATATATTLDQFTAAFPKIQVVRDRRFVDSGKVITTQGLSAGMDGALHVVDRVQGRLRAQDLALYLEYPWQPDGQGGFGSLARMIVPDLSVLFPDSASWDKRLDQGDAEHWQIAGHLEMSQSAAVFLNDGATALGRNGWKLRSSDPNSRNFTKSANGQAWQFTVSLTKTSVPANYELSMKIAKLPQPGTKPGAPSAS
ncbi:MAG: DJ-1/PfpI family protein [Xanthomonadales bacterium]|nr:DJ-1/PfpI family protein [Xanthomonadales bacterium]